MASLFSRLFRRSPRALPSYAPVDTTQRTFIGKITHSAILVGSLYCTSELIRHYLLDYGFSEGPSMVPTIPASQSMSIGSPLYRNGKNIKVGDIVHAKNPLLPHSKIGKRVIGLPGDYVLKDPSLSPTAGGASLPPIFQGDGERKEPAMIQVPEGHVWLAGDNMSRSRDSRFYGAVPLGMIESKLLFIGDGLLNWTSVRKDQLILAGALHADDLRARTKEEKAIGTSVD
jgi:mitochondrial inner membrane protease subunit 1